MLHGMLLLSTKSLVESTGPYTIKNRSESVKFPIVNMWQKHSVGISVPHLFRSNIYIVLIFKYIKEKLCGIKNLAYCRLRVLASYNRKEGNSIKDKEEGAGHSEEIAHHKVGRPCRLKLRQTIKYIKSVSSFPLNVIVDSYRKILKSMR